MVTFPKNTFFWSKKGQKRGIFGVKMTPFLTPFLTPIISDLITLHSDSGHFRQKVVKRGSKNELKKGSFLGPLQIHQSRVMT